MRQNAKMLLCGLNIHGNKNNQVLPCFKWFVALARPFNDRKLITADNSAVLFH